jgi:hypothetical protein
VAGSAKKRALAEYIFSHSPHFSSKNRDGWTPSFIYYGPAKAVETGEDDGA